MGTEVVRRTVAYITTEEAELKRPRQKPFYWARLGRSQVETLAESLGKFAKEEGRVWFTLVVTREAPGRIRLTQMVQTPAYEARAHREYLRGEIFRLSGREGSCNIDFSPIGAKLLLERLNAAAERMRYSVLIRVPMRSRQMVEFIPDTDLPLVQTEIEKLGQAGEELAASVLPSDDFADWQEA